MKASNWLYHFSSDSSVWCCLRLAWVGFTHGLGSIGSDFFTFLGFCLSNFNKHKKREWVPPPVIYCKLSTKQWITVNKYSFYIIFCITTVSCYNVAQFSGSHVVSPLHKSIRPWVWIGHISVIHTGLGWVRSDGSGGLAQWRRQRGGRGEASPPMGGRPKIM